MIINLLGDATWVNSSILNRYSLATLSFNNIVFEEYFVQILFLRFRTVVGLWILSKLFPKKIVIVGFAIGMSVLLGSVAAMAVLANGVWGILFFIGALVPHIICYIGAFIVWSNSKVEYSMTGKRTGRYLTSLFIPLLVGIGCILETYINPILIKNVIKY